MSDYVDRHWGGWSAKIFRHFFNKDNVYIIRFKNRRIGLYDLEFRKNHSYIKSIQISGKFRNKGIGTYLIKIIENNTKKKKLKSIRLGVIKDNPAIKMYNKLGFKKINETESEIIMKKNIS